jgi:hypothetical protein
MTVPGRPGAPVPSTTRPPLMTRSTLSVMREQLSHHASVHAVTISDLELSLVSLRITFRVVM